nr:hypothetical protein [Tanacetum cinerariifolium]
MTIQSSIKDRILVAQNEASKVVDAPTEMLPSGLPQQHEIPEGKYERMAIDFITRLQRTGNRHDAIWVIMDRLTKFAHFLPIYEDFKMDRLARLYLNEIVARHGVPVSIISDRDRVLHQEVGEGQLIGPKIVQETTEKILQIKDRLRVVRDHKKSYADKRRKPSEFSVGNHVLVKVSPWKGVVRFGKKGKLTP